MFTWGLLGLQPGRHRFKKHLNSIPLYYKIESAYKGKTLKFTVGYMNDLSRIIIGAGKKQGCLLGKDWLWSEMVEQLKEETALRPQVCS